MSPVQELYLRSIHPGLPPDPDVGAGLAVTRFPCLVGRQQDCDLILTDPMVSRRHSMIYLKGDEVWLRDLGSRNGTFVNGMQVEASALQDGDLVRVGPLLFDVRLPAVPGAPPVKPAAAATPPPAPRQPHRVLVVDDNPVAADTLAMLLQGWGHQVRVARDGAEAIAAARAETPDAIVLDLCLPKIDGYQVAKALRAQPETDKTLLVAVTGYGSEEEEYRSHKAGFHRLLTKPVDPGTLCEVLSAGGEG